jgi:hypothetical protein
MTCRDVVDLVEVFAAGDLEVGDDMRGHLETCPSCAAALASARRIETMLLARVAVEPPASFATAVLARIRDDRWQLEQRVDRIFNVAIVVSALMIAAGIAALTNVGAVLAASAWALRVIGNVSAGAVEAATPMAPTYAAAAGLLMSALVMWWWAERRLSL